MKPLAPLLLALAGVFAQDAAPPVPVVQRLDRTLDAAVAAAKQSKGDGAAELTAVLAEHRDVYARLGHDSPEAYASILLGKHAITEEVAAARTFFRKRDLTAEVRAGYARTIEALGAAPEHAPTFWLAHGWKNGTNAQTADPSPDRSAVAVYLNLPALAVGRHFDAAVVHESVHTVQPSLAGRTLLDRAVYEGVATHVSRVLVEKLSDHDAMFWPKDAWRAAEKRRPEILAAFEAELDATEQRDVAPFLYLNVPLEDVPGAPDRAGYYVGMLAAEAWMEEDASRTLADLLAAKPAELWAALRAREG